MWSGAIQPSRFLSHTGRVLPGVRRFVTIPAPGAGNEWQVEVPGGVQWLLVGGSVIFTAAASGTNESCGVEVEVQSIVISRTQSGNPITATAPSLVTYTSDPAVASVIATQHPPVAAVPAMYIPEGGIIRSNTAALAAGDTYGIVSLFIEEVYVTDPQLSEIARTRAELDREIAQYEFEQATTAGGTT